MVAEGHCNCNSIKVSIPALPVKSGICYCSNCKRAGSSMCSIVFMLDHSEVDIQDPSGALKNYTDANTKSGNAITRQFCGNCGSPVASLVPGFPKIILKAGLFDQLPEPGHSVFEEDRPAWMKVVNADEAEK